MSIAVSRVESLSQADEHFLAQVKVTTPASDFIVFAVFGSLALVSLVVAVILTTVTITSDYDLTVQARDFTGFTAIFGACAVLGRELGKVQRVVRYVSRGSSGPNKVLSKVEQRYLARMRASNPEAYAFSARILLTLAVCSFIGMVVVGILSNFVDVRFNPYVRALIVVANVLLFRGLAARERAKGCRIVRYVGSEECV